MVVCARVDTVHICFSLLLRTELPAGLDSSCVMPSAAVSFRLALKADSNRTAAHFSGVHGKKIY